MSFSACARLPHNACMPTRLLPSLARTRGLDLRRGFGLLALLAACEGDPPAPCAPPVALADQRLRVDGRVLRDAAGRAVLLRGINTGGRSKDPPFMPFEFAEAGHDAPPFAEALAIYVDRVADWGLNVARVPFSWEALEPTRGTYDGAYLDRYVALVEALGARDVRVIVDFHQDVFHRAFCGDGFPAWALPPEPGAPPASCRYWFTGYLTHEGVKAAYDRFWANTDGLQTAFEAMWRHVAARLWAAPNVIGFEIINEPGWGTADPDVWAVEVLAPFYARLAAVVREQAPDALVFVDSTGADALDATTSLPRPETEGIVFAPHFYVPSVILQGRWDRTGDIPGALARWDAVGGLWNAPVLLGEFGVPPDDGGVAYLREHYAALDVLGMHATLWEYSTSGHVWNEESLTVTTPDGREHSTVDALVRPYPAAVAGEVSLLRYDPDARALELRYVAEAGGISEIRLPARLWPGGPRVELSRAQGCFELDGDRLRIRARFDEQITLRVR